MYPVLPEWYAGAPAEDYGDALIVQSFADLHLHAPQYPMLGTGMDLPLLDWLNAYAFPTEARFADPDYARQVYRQLAGELASHGTTRVCMFSSLHTDATLILMEELEQAGITGLVGKVNMDRSGAPDLLEETTEESVTGNPALAGSVSGLPAYKAHPDPPVYPLLHRCADGLSGEAGGGAKSAGAVPPVGKPCRNRTGQDAAPGLPAVLGNLCEVRPVEPADADGSLRLVRCPGAAGHEGRRGNGGPLRRLQSESLLRRGSGAGDAPDEGPKVALGSDIAGGDHLDMFDVAASSIRRVQSPADAGRLGNGRFSPWRRDGIWPPPPVRRTSGKSRASLPGNSLHAMVLADDTLPQPRPLTPAERLERAVYRRQASALRAVWSAGRKIYAAEPAR